MTWAHLPRVAARFGPKARLAPIFVLGHVFSLIVRRPPTEKLAIRYVQAHLTGLEPPVVLVVPGHRASSGRLALGLPRRHPGALPPASGHQRRQLHAAGRQVLGHADTSASLSLKKSVHPQDAQLPAAAVAPWCAILRKACLWTGGSALPA